MVAKRVATVQVSATANTSVSNAVNDVLGDPSIDKSQDVQGTVTSEDFFQSDKIVAAYIDPNYCPGDSDEERLANLTTKPFEWGHWRNYGGEPEELPEIFFCDLWDAYGNHQIPVSQIKTALGKFLNGNILIMYGQSPSNLAGFSTDDPIEIEGGKNAGYYRYYNSQEDRNYQPPDYWSNEKEVSDFKTSVKVGIDYDDSNRVPDGDIDFKINVTKGLGSENKVNQYIKYTTKDEFATNLGGLKEGIEGQLLMASGAGLYVGMDWSLDFVIGLLKTGIRWPGILIPPGRYPVTTIINDTTIVPAIFDLVPADALQKPIGDTNYKDWLKTYSVGGTILTPRDYRELVASGDIFESPPDEWYCPTCNNGDGGWRIPPGYSRIGVPLDPEDVIITNDGDGQICSSATPGAPEFTPGDALWVTDKTLEEYDINREYDDPALDKDGGLLFNGLLDTIKVGLTSPELKVGMVGYVTTAENVAVDIPEDLFAKAKNLGVLMEGLAIVSSALELAEGFINWSAFQFETLENLSEALGLTERIDSGLYTYFIETQGLYNDETVEYSRYKLGHGGKYDVSSPELQTKEEDSVSHSFNSPLYNEDRIVMTNLVQDPIFNTGIGWNYNSEWSLENNTLRLTNNISTDSIVTQDITVYAGEHYEIEFTCENIYSTDLSINVEDIFDITDSNKYSVLEEPSPNPGSGQFRYRGVAKTSGTYTLTITVEAGFEGYISDFRMIEIYYTFPYNTRVGESTVLRKYFNFDFLPVGRQYDFNAAPPLVMYEVTLEAVKNCKLSTNKPTKFNVMVVCDRYISPLFVIDAPTFDPTNDQSIINRGDNILFRNARFADYMVVQNLDSLGGIFNQEYNGYINTDGQPDRGSNSTGNNLVPIEFLNDDYYLESLALLDVDVKIDNDSSIVLYFFKDGDSQLVKNPEFINRRDDRFNMQAEDIEGTLYSVIKLYWDASDDWKWLNGLIRKSNTGQATLSQEIEDIIQSTTSVKYYYRLTFDAFVTSGKFYINCYDTFSTKLKDWSEYDGFLEWNERENLVDVRDLPSGITESDGESPYPLERAISVSESMKFDYLLETRVSAESDGGDIAKELKFYTSSDFIGDITSIRLQRVKSMSGKDTSRGFVPLARYDAVYNASFNLSYSYSFDMLAKVGEEFSFTSSYELLQLVPQTSPGNKWLVISVDWGDGTSSLYDSLTVFDDIEFTHTFDIKKLNTITVSMVGINIYWNVIKLTKLICNYEDLKGFDSKNTGIKDLYVDFSDTTIGINSSDLFYNFRSGQISEMYMNDCSFLLYSNLNYLSITDSINLNNSTITGIINYLNGAPGNNISIDADNTWIYKYESYNRRLYNVDRLVWKNIPTSFIDQLVIADEYESQEDYRTGSQNSLQQSLYKVLEDLDYGDVTNGYLDIAGDNPSIDDTTALAHITNLVDVKGWTVLYNTSEDIVASINIQYMPSEILADAIESTIYLTNDGGASCDVDIELDGLPIESYAGVTSGDTIEYSYTGGLSRNTTYNVVITIDNGIDVLIYDEDIIYVTEVTKNPKDLIRNNTQVWFPVEADITLDLDFDYWDGSGAVSALEWLVTDSGGTTLLTDVFTTTSEVAKWTNKTLSLTKTRFEWEALGIDVGSEDYYIKYLINNGYGDKYTTPALITLARVDMQPTLILNEETLGDELELNVLMNYAPEATTIDYTLYSVDIYNVTTELDFGTISGTYITGQTATETFSGVEYPQRNVKYRVELEAESTHLTGSATIDYTETTNDDPEIMVNTVDGWNLSEGYYDLVISDLDIWDGGQKIASTYVKLYSDAAATNEIASFEVDDFDDERFKRYINTSLTYSMPDYLFDFLGLEKGTSYYFKLEVTGYDNNYVGESNIFSAVPRNIIWDIDTISITQTVGKIGTAFYPQDIAVKPDETIFYLGGHPGSSRGDLESYNMTVAGDLTTQVADSFQSSRNTQNQGVFIRQDTGTYIYLIDAYNDCLLRLDLPTPWSLGGATVTQLLAFGSVKRGVCFNNAGTKFITGGSIYTLSTPWDLNTAIETSTGAVSGEGLFINDAGTVVITCDGSGGQLSQYGLSTPWDLATASLTNTRIIPGVTSALQGIHILEDKGVGYLCGVSTASLYKFSF